MSRGMLSGLLKIEPFRPITVHTTSRSSYLVLRRESIWLAPESDTVVISTGGEGFVMVAMDHITSLTVSEPQTGEI